MAAAALIQKAARTLGVGDSLDNTEACSEGVAGEIEVQKEKEEARDGTIVAGGYVEPEQAVMAPREEAVGATKEVLGVGDFELLRILGTGEYSKRVCGGDGTDAGVIGTFARVWLVRMKNPKSGDEKQVFALKVLRKAEGER